MALALSLCAVAFAESDDPVVVRVGPFSYPLSVVETSLDSALDVASMLSGESVSDEDRQAGVEAVIEKFVNMGLIECKLAEKGKDDFTEAEQEIMKSAAQSKYEELWQSLYQRARQSGEEVSEEDITGWLEGEGYTVEAIYDEYVVSERNHRAIELFPGLRVLNQPPWEALVCFILSANNNVSRIRGLTDALCRAYGRE